MKRSLLPALSIAVWAAAAVACAAPVDCPLRPAPALGEVALQQNFPDPFILPVEGGLLAYATEADERHRVQVACARAGGGWTLLPQDALSDSIAWAAAEAHVWAPEVTPVPGGFRLFFSASHVGLTRPIVRPDDTPRRRCIGTAFSDRPDRDFVADPHPLVCAYEEGVIDGSPVRDGDRLLLLFKTDGNCCGRTTRLMIQPLTPDGARLAGAPTPLEIERAPTADQGVAEAPTLVEHDGRYVLFYSVGDFRDASYGIRYAVCDSAFGRCEEQPDSLLLGSRTDVRGRTLNGPGHQSVFRENGHLRIAFHSRLDDGTRQLRFGDIRWAGDRPTVVLEPE